MDFANLKFMFLFLRILIFRKLRNKQNIKYQPKGPKLHFQAKHFYILNFILGSAGSDDYEILIPPQILTNLTWSQLGPKYQVDKPVQLEILGPRY